MRFSFIVALLLAGIPGCAQFGAPIAIEDNEAENPLALQPMDVDQDGLMDLIVSNQEHNAVFWYRNEGAGDFAPQQTLIPDAPYLFTMEVFDMDGDGDQDIVGTVFNGNRLVWYKNEGPSLFGPMVVIADAPGQPRALVLADLDGDGLDDLVFATYYVGRIDWVRNLGGGNFGDVLPVANNISGVNCIAKADIDGDGLWDILSTSSQYGAPVLAWHRNQQGGAVFTSTVISSIDSVQYVLTTDLNDDGAPDVIIGSAATDEVIAFMNVGGTFSEPVVIASGVSNILWMITFDADLDGDLDIVCSTYPENSVLLLRNTGTGQFDAPDPVSGLVAFVRSMHAIDLDADGLQDLAYLSLGDDRVVWHRNMGLGVFGPQRELTSQVRGASWVTTADLDGDLDLDVLSASQEDNRIAWYENLGNGNFGVQRTITNEMMRIQCVTSADIDGDGDMDVLGCSWNDHTIASFFNDGAGHFGGAQMITTTANRVSYLNTADLDLDGDMDLVASGFSYFVYYLNTGNGEFGEPIPLTGYTSGDIPFAMADLDRDGLVDIVHITSGYSRLAWFKNLGSGSFSPQVVIAQYVSGGPLLAAGDMDGDRDVDLLIGTSTELQLFPNDGSGQFSLPVSFGVENSQADALVVVDVDGDGLNDVLSANNTLNLIAYYRNLGSRQFAPRELLPFTLSGPRCLHATQVDGNSSPDILCATYWDDRIFWLRNYFGSPYKATGRRFIDADGDGLQGTEESGVAWASINCSPNLNYALTSQQGEYEFHLDTGQFAISAIPQASYWQLTTSNSSYSIHLTNDDPIIRNLDFGYQATVDTSLMDASLQFGTGPCGGQLPIWFSFKNIGTRVEQGHISLQLDTMLTFVSSNPAPEEQIGNTLYWSFEDLLYFQTNIIQLNVISPGVEFLGATMNSLLTVITENDDGQITGTWSVTHSSVVTCAYDPNDKQVEPSGYGHHGACSMETGALTYVVRFQNTGTALAYDVTIRDQLSSALDLDDIELLGFSHEPSEMRIDPNGVLVVRFRDILLPDSGTSPLESQGFVRFRIRLIGSLPHLTTITNTAEIYFDFNPPILTNSTLNTLVDCQQWQPMVTTLSTNVLEVSPGTEYQWYLNGTALATGTDRTLVIDSIGVYSALVTSEYGCVSLTDEVNVLVLGIPSRSATTLTLVPNPFTTVSRLIFNSPITRRHLVDIIDVHGRVVQQHHGVGDRELIIHREDLSSGVYMVRITYAGAILGTARLVLD